MERKPSVIRLNPEDNVVVARCYIPEGSFIEEENLRTLGPVPKGHKVATETIPKGAVVRKYGHPIGVALEDIPAGAWVHTHNVGVAKATMPRRRKNGSTDRPSFHELEELVFMGIPRDSGKVGTRNYIGVLPTVNCSATVARAIADTFREACIPGVDGVVALPHGEGCAMKSSGEGFEAFKRVFEGYISHPNFGGVLVVGLGCEVNQVDALLTVGGGEPNPQVQGLVIQKTFGTTRTIEEGVRIVESMISRAKEPRRRPFGLEHLVLGVECGGSDAYSGITANPALGVAADMLVACGGTVILSETPEIYGAEHLLLQRARSRDVSQKLLERIRWWERYVRANQGEMDNNPSPGNKEGGLTTIFEKSLGAVAKGGTTELVEVYKYAERVDKKGLVFMDTPGYDPASVTGMVAGGANIIAFTTGRGSAFGCKPVPVVKIATTTELYAAMENDMDLHCGTLIEGSESLQEIGYRIFRKLVDVASGEKSKSELMGYGDLEFVPWRIGALM